MAEREKDDPWSTERDWRTVRLPKAGKGKMMRPNAWRKHKKHRGGKKT